MVYQIFSDGIDRRLSLGGQRHSSKHQRISSKKAPAPTRTPRKKNNASHASATTTTANNNNSAWLNPKSRAFYSNLLIIFIKLVLFAYDVVTLPIYFAHQRPDRRANAARRLRSRQVDANTWVRPGMVGDELGLASSSKKSNQSTSSGGGRNEQKRKWKFMGATVGEMFANAIKEFNSTPCLGYRALVTCPVITLDESGKHVFRDQSFRSDFTWYTYGQIGRRVQDLASGLYSTGLYPGARAMFLASSCLEWFCMAHACFQLAIQLVLWPEMNNDPQTLANIIQESRVEALFVTCDQLDKLCQLLLSFAHGGGGAGDHHHLPLPAHLSKIIIIDWQFAINFDELHFVQLGQTLNELRATCEANPTLNSNQQLEVLSIGQVEEAGIERPIELRCSRALSDENLALSQPIDQFAAKQQQQKPSRFATKYDFKPTERGGEELAIKARRNAELELDLARKISDTSPPRGLKDWSLGSELIDATTTTPCMSAPLTRRKLAPPPPHSIDGNSKELETSLLNSYRDLTSRHRTTSSRSSINSNSIAAPATNSSPINNAAKLAKPDDLALIVYTFGHLGQLKAVMLSHNQLARSNHQLFLDGLIGQQSRHCAVLSLDCIIELMAELSVFSRGGSIGYSNNLKTLFYDGKELFERDQSDLEMAQPDHLLVRPYILEQLRASLQNYLQLQLNPLIGFVFKNVIYEYKKFWARRHYDTPLVDRLFCSLLRRFFGTKIKHILCNGTTDSSETKDFFAFMVNLPIIELYGPDEAIGSMISVNDTFDYNAQLTRNKRRRHRRKPRAAAAATTRRSLFEEHRRQVIETSDDEDEAEDEGHELDRDSYGPDDEEGDEGEGNTKDFGDMQLLPPRRNRNVYRENFSKNILITSSIFCPTSGTRIRLEDWEEFRLTDLPYPRGRLVLGGDSVCKGYLVADDHQWPPATAAATTTAKQQIISPLARDDHQGKRQTFFRDSNGVSWFRTGDIARAFPNGSFELVSAISNMIKMVDGQFVSLSQIEHILRSNQFVDNVCALCGDDRTLVINLVVPNLRRLALKSPNEANLKLAIGAEPEPDELADVEFRREVCNDRLLCEFVTGDLKRLLAKSGLASITNRFLLVPEIWTPESELVTAAFEPKRQAVQKFYANDIQSLIRMQARKGSKRLSANSRRQMNNSTSLR